jgi:hypothetical protein
MLRLGGDLPHDVDALGFEALKMAQAHGSERTEPLGAGA